MSKGIKTIVNLFRWCRSGHSKPAYQSLGFVQVNKQIFQEEDQGVADW